MKMYDIIQKKRDKCKLSKEEIEYFVNGYVKDEIPDYQSSALLMAIYLNGMTDDEITNLTMAMANSGEMLDLSGIEGKKVDKHSTGGVGDKTTLIVAPIVASVGCKVAKMSGRGLGFTGGTTDKLESIEGYQVELPRKDFINQVNQIGISVISQSENLAPADKKIYKLRDVTATIESIPLIASSIMSKKIASGADYIVLDVKTGEGAFMKTFDRAKELANKLVNIGNLAGKKTVALITNMNIPLGYEVGNSLEVKEAIKVLNGEGPTDLTNICIELATCMVMLCKNIDKSKAEELVKESISNGSAFNKFKELVEYQHGNVSWIENPDLFPKAKYNIEVSSNTSGYIYKMNAEKIGKISCSLGSGRERKEDKIDYSAGITLLKKTGDFVNKGDVLAILHTNLEDSIDVAKEKYLEALEISDLKPEKEKLVYDIVM